MNLLLVFISIIVLSLFVISKVIGYRRLSYINKLNSIYEEMEMVFVRRNIILKNDYIEFLKVFKNLSINPRYLDIQILLLIKMKTESSKFKDNSKWFNETLESLPKEFNSLFIEFNSYSDKIIKLSFYKPDFILFLFKLLRIQMFNRGVNSYKKLIKEFKFALRNEEVLSYTDMKSQIALS
mgnify:CR=1 FL=1